MSVNEYYLKRLKLKATLNNEDAQAYKAKLVHVKNQISVAEDAAGLIRLKCVCGKRVYIEDMYRCLYCGEWYCRKCAEAHFDKTIEEYENEKK